MFPKGPRFEPSKPNDVPGPNAYNLIQDSQMDAYKRGAFLEKADRFDKDKGHDGPGPSSTVAASATTTNLADLNQSVDARYAALQRKLEDLERVHKDDKRSAQTKHKVEVEQLKQEILSKQKSHQEQTERIEKQKKQIESLEACLQELKKVSTSEQAEVKALRLRLRSSESELIQTSALRTEVETLKKVVRSHKIELQEKDKKVAGLEKLLSVEVTRRDSAMAQLEGLTSSSNDELAALRLAGIRAQKSAEESELALEALQSQFVEKECNLSAQLESYRDLVAKITGQYSELVSRTVCLSEHNRLKTACLQLQMQVLRLERKVANAEGQVAELAYLIRQKQDLNSHLYRQLYDAEAILASVAGVPDLASIDQGHCRLCGVQPLAEEFSVCWRQQEGDIRKVEALTATHYQLLITYLLLIHSTVHQILSAEFSENDKLKEALAAAIARRVGLTSHLELANHERARLEEQVATECRATQLLKEESAVCAARNLTLEENLRANAAQSERMLKEEKENTRRVADIGQAAKQAEEALRIEVEQLTAELLDLENYREAYLALTTEVNTLIARNQLAESEAARLSQFNTEILSHNNPAQRIVYVDRIRRELAETKLKLQVLLSDHQMLQGRMAALQDERDAYMATGGFAVQHTRTTINRAPRNKALVHEGSSRPVT